jgi:hypothetical protein
MIAFRLVPTDDVPFVSLVASLPLLLCRDISIEIDDGSAMVNAMGAQKAKDYKCLG